MPTKDSGRAREQSKLRMRKKRQGVTSGVTKAGCNMEGVTGIVPALLDPVKREKLEHIVSALDKPIQPGGSVMGGHLSDHVRYGINGPTFTIVKELLDATD